MVGYFIVDSEKTFQELRNVSRKPNGCIYGVVTIKQTTYRNVSSGEVRVEEEVIG